MNNLIYIIDELQAIYGFCPCCGEIFRFADAKLKFPSFISKDDPIFKLKLLESRVSRQQESLERYEEKMDAALVLARERAQSKGRTLAKKRLKMIDPIFFGRNIDSQDVKTIFDPVDFVVFDRMNSESGIIKGIEFIALEPKSKERDLVLNSIDKAVQRGNLDFKVIRVDKQGEIEVE